MKLLKQEKPQCLLYAFAMVLDEDPESLIEEIGHDGLEIWWATSPRERGFHPQEFVDCCVARGIRCMVIEAMPCHANHGTATPKPLFDVEYATERFLAFLQEFSGVLTDSIHAVAWNKVDSLIYDPNGHIYPLERFTPQYFFAIG